MTDSSSENRNQTADPKAVSESRRPSPEGAPRKTVTANRYFIVSMFLSSVLILLVLTAVAFYKQKVAVAFGPKEAGFSTQNMLQVGPIVATLANLDIVKLSLEIDCRTSASKQWLSRKEALVKNQVLDIIMSPDSEALLETRQYDQIKSRLRGNLEKISGFPLGDVYFSELKVY